MCNIVPMSNLHIRNIPEDTYRAAKIAAVKAGVTLRAYVITVLKAKCQDDAAGKKGVRSGK